MSTKSEEAGCHCQITMLGEALEETILCCLTLVRSDPPPLAGLRLGLI